MLGAGKIWIPKIRRIPQIGQPITHGICSDCRRSIEHESVKITEFLDSIKAPVLLVNSDKRIEFANQIALKLLDTDQKSVKNKLGGEVIRCIYSELPEGCGETIHCSGCRIRLSVSHTMETEDPLYNQEAFEFMRTPNGIEEFSVFITTEKIGTNVLLRIEKMEPKHSLP